VYHKNDYPLESEGIRMNEEWREAPFSNKFINFWMGWWILIYGLPLSIKASFADFDFAIWGLMHAVWLVNACRILFRNLSVKANIIALGLGISLPVLVITDLITKDISYKMFRNPPLRDELNIKYHVYGLIAYIFMVILPLIIFIFTKIYIQKLKRSGLYLDIDKVEAAD
jgi:hypothetical protein